MTTNMSGTRRETQDRILTVLGEQGPIRIRALSEAVGAHAYDVSSETMYLAAVGLVVRDRTLYRIA